MLRPRPYAVALSLAALAVVAGAQAASNTTDTCLDPKSTLTTRVIQCFAQTLAPVNNTCTFDAAAALRSCFSSVGQEPLVTQGIFTPDFVDFVGILLNAFTARFGMEALVRFVAEEAMMAEVRFLVAQNVSSALSFFIAPSTNTVDLAYLNVLADLQDFINRDTSGLGLVWTEMHQFYRERVAVFDSKVVSIPLGAPLPYMYYRKDVFAALNLTVPDTWEEALAVAQVLATTDWDPSVPAKMPLCFAKPLANETGSRSPSFLLANIYGSLVQYRGQAQGLLFDPATMEPLVNSPPMAHALALYHKLAALMPDVPEVVFTSTHMQEGRCALGFQWSEVFKRSPLPPRAVYGRLGTKMLPGSTKVWDRTTQAWVDCSQSLCLGSDAIIRPDPAQPSSSVTRWVNRMLFIGAAGGLGLVVNALSPPAYQQVGYQFIALSGRILHTNPYLFTPALPVPPIRAMDLTLSNITAWLTAGYDRNDVIGWLTAHLAMLAHPNTMLDFRLPDQSVVKTILDDAARHVELHGVSVIPDIMAQMGVKLRQAAANFSGGATAFAAIYKKGIEYVAPPSPAPPTLAAMQGPQDILSTGGIVGLTVGVVSSAIAISMLLWLLVSSQLNLRNRTLLGKVVPPGLGPQTTLLVTDVQGSTQLWDSMPSSVMEAAIALHFAVLRKVAAQHDGHESSTEGDSIILGFHQPLGAVQAALTAQEALLAADWPTQLLEHPLCAGQYVAALVQGDSEGGMPPFPLWDGHFVHDDAPAMQDISFFSETSRVQSNRLKSTLAAFAGLSFMGSRKNGSQGPSGGFPSPTGQGSPVQSACQGTSSGLNFLRATSDMSRPGDVQSAASAALCQPMTAQEYLRQMFSMSSSPQDNSRPAVPIFRGLRVRMGLHMGLNDPSSVTVSPSSGRLQYAGTPLAIATSVCSAGHGGMVLLTSDTFEAVQAACRPHSIFLASMGQQRLLDLDLPCVLYLAYSRDLVYRAFTQPSLRYAQQLSPSFLDAPCGQVTVCFMSVVGMASLTAWSADITREALNLYEKTATTELDRWGGYLVNSSGGLVVAAFLAPARAIRWALTTVCQCLEADWSPALLEHELAEEVVIDHAMAADLDGANDCDMPMPSAGRAQSSSGGDAQGDGPAVTTHTSVRSSLQEMDSRNTASRHIQRTVLFRGLRIKGSVDIGWPRVVVDPATGRMQYFGRIMNRAARINQSAKTGQVWSTSEAWDLAAPVINTNAIRHAGGQGEHLTLHGDRHMLSDVQVPHIGAALAGVPEASAVTSAASLETSVARDSTEGSALSTSPHHMVVWSPRSQASLAPDQTSAVNQSLTQMAPQHDGATASAASDDTVQESHGARSIASPSAAGVMLQTGAESLPLLEAAKPEPLPSMLITPQPGDDPTAPSTFSFAGPPQASLFKLPPFRLSTLTAAYTGRSSVGSGSRSRGHKLQALVLEPPQGFHPCNRTCAHARSHPVNGIARGWKVVVGLPLGTCKLRGIQEEVSLVQCLLGSSMPQAL